MVVRVFINLPQNRSEDILVANGFQGRYVSESIDHDGVSHSHSYILFNRAKSINNIRMIDLCFTKHSFYSGSCFTF